MFERPNPDAIIRTNINNQQYQSARIIVVSPDGFQQTVTIQVTGQISVS
jgi:VCBS repeat-containing protein